MTVEQDNIDKSEALDANKILPDSIIEKKDDKENIEEESSNEGDINSFIEDECKDCEEDEESEK